MKRNFLCTLFFLLFSFIAICQTKIVANITNFKNDEGVCRACLFNNPSSFKGEAGEPFRCVTVAVKSQAAQAVFTVPKGTYALFVFHDANNNNKMDKNFLGIPKEGYGASKNKLPFAGAPTYKDNTFQVEDKTPITLQVKLRNL